LGLKEKLGERVAIDAAIFIYYIEENDHWLSVVDPIFELARTGELTLVTSELTLHEVLVVPYRSGNLALAERYEAFLERSNALSLIPIGRGNLKHAAYLRARYRVKGADAVQLAAALDTQCSAFVTNDRRIPDISGLRIVQLKELT